MDPTNKHQRRAYSASASVSRVTVGKTPLARMMQVVELGRRGRLIEKLASHGRTRPHRAR